MKQVISVSGALKTPFSPAIRAGDYIFVSGQVGHDIKTGNKVEGIEAQTRQCLENLKQVLAAADASLDDVVKVTIFLGKASDFSKMNEIYQGYFTKDLPTRSTVIAGLALPEMLVEIECIAYSPS